MCARIANIWRWMTFAAADSVFLFQANFSVAFFFFWFGFLALTQEQEWQIAERMSKRHNLPSSLSPSLLPASVFSPSSSTPHFLILSHSHFWVYFYVWSCMTGFPAGGLGGGWQKTSKGMEGEGWKKEGIVWASLICHHHGSLWLLGGWNYIWLWS